ncbi:AAA family ATPase [Neobacillus sp. CF12]|uniref:AAA family ATPase n=1 Tax=Neobacillus sp. CF12 TaxID=3055864 RepID=UPI0025A0E04C|nr:AAA family ATPase [Neobacillus sp. CF12]MDM5326847.1 AAA family ATPase [Neobacillus sp. CF12]
MTNERWEVDYDGTLVWKPSAISQRNRGKAKIELIKQLFVRDGWQCEILGDSTKFIHIRLTNPHTTENLEYNVALLNVVNDSRPNSNNPDSGSSYEKRIQGQDLKEIICPNKLIFGIYVLESEEDINHSIIVAWPEEILTSGSNRAYRVNTKKDIQPARLFGLYSDQSSAYNSVTFKPQNIYLYLKNRDILHRFHEDDETRAEDTTHTYGPLDRPHNRILFGAPGTGKSFKINEDKDKYFTVNQFERVTFHPNYSYAQFVGTYKPIPKRRTENGNMIEYISYEFVPGPFLRLWVKAFKSKQLNEDKNYLLIIEEINRANVAAVFGDIFQLLDRNLHGTSEYSIHISEDMRKYLVNECELAEEDALEVRLPDNLYIWATMNSADQGVQPMDAAFKRRWNFEYIDINAGSEKISGKIMNLKPFGEIEWNTLRNKINDRLSDSDLNINEDKLIGPFFLGDQELASPNIDDIFKSKLLMYLFEDVLKHRKGKFFLPLYNTFSKLLAAYDAGINIFDFPVKNISYEKQDEDDQMPLQLAETIE